MTSIRSLCINFSAFLSVLTASAALATPTFQITGTTTYSYNNPDNPRIGSGFYSDVQFNQTQPTFLSNSFNIDGSEPGGQTRQFFGYAGAGVGRLQAAAAMTYTSTLPVSLSEHETDTYASQTTASALFKDVVISGPAGGSITTSFNVHLSGNVSGGSSGVTGSAYAANASIALSANGNPVGSGGYGANSDRIVATGLLQNFTGSGTLTTDPFTVQFNVPFTIRLDLSATASAALDYFYGGGGQASVDFAHTLTFATDRPVFNLPDGYTVNSADAGIVNNQFVAVPEVSSILLTAAGVLAGVAAWKRPRSKED